MPKYRRSNVYGESTFSWIVDNSQTFDAPDKLFWELMRFVCYSHRPFTLTETIGCIFWWAHLGDPFCKRRREQLIVIRAAQRLGVRNVRG